MQKKQKWNNKIPDWLNIVLVICIFVTLLYGAKIFLNNYDTTTGNHNYEAFFPSGICVGFYFIILFIANLFANTDMASVMMITLLISGFVVLGIGIYSKDQSSKSTSFEFAAAILGLALGIPFGDRLRSAQAQINSDENKKQQPKIKSKQDQP